MTRRPRPAADMPIQTRGAATAIADAGGIRQSRARLAGDEGRAPGARRLGGVRPSPDSGLRAVAVHPRASGRAWSRPDLAGRHPAERLPPPGFAASPTGTRRSLDRQIGPPRAACRRTRIWSPVPHREGSACARPPSPTQGDDAPSFPARQPASARSECGVCAPAAGPCRRALRSAARRRNLDPSPSPRPRGGHPVDPQAVRECRTGTDGPSSAGAQLPKWRPQA